MPTIEDDSYRCRINKYINENKKLKDTNPKQMLIDSEVAELIEGIDIFFANQAKHKTKIGFEKLPVMLCVKLMLFTGIKYGIARKLTLDQYDSFANTITINGFNIRMPINLSKQFQYYLNLRTKQLCSNTNNALFVTEDGNQWGEKTPSSKIPLLLIQYFGRPGTTGVTKYGIHNLFQVGVDIKIIKQITGAEDTLINSCTYIDKKTAQIELDRYINSRVSNMEVFYKL